MATVNAQKSTGLVALTAATVDTVNLASYGKSLRIFNHAATNIVWVRMGRTAATVTDPTVGGAECLAVPPNSNIEVEWPLEASGLTGCCVKLISTGAQTYTVQSELRPRLG